MGPNVVKHPAHTPATDWKRREELVTLPSGKQALLRAPNVINMIMGDGAMPDFLVKQMTDALTGNNEESTPAEGEDENLDIGVDDFRALIGIADAVTRAAMVQPRLCAEGETPNYDSGEISLDDIDFPDRMFIMQWASDANGLAGAVTNFRT